MRNTVLKNYLRTLRKQTGLSQDDVAFLIGSRPGTTVGRHENRVRLPALKTALAYEVVYRTHVEQLFAGELRKVERDIQGRAKRLIKNLRRMPSSPSRMRKLKTLGEIAHRSFN